MQNRPDFRRRCFVELMEVVEDGIALELAGEEQRIRRVSNHALDSHFVRRDGERASGLRRSTWTNAKRISASWP
jgi:hypothetical protein